MLAPLLPQPTASGSILLPPVTIVVVKLDGAKEFVSLHKGDSITLFEEITRIMKE